MSYASLKKRVETESEIHKQDNQKSMNDNVLLIKDIRGLREKVTELEKRLSKQKTRKTGLEKDIKEMFAGQDTSDLTQLGKGKRNLNDDEEIQKLRSLCENRRNHVMALRQSIEDAKQEQMQLE